MRRFSEHYVRGLGMAASTNALAFGYSITITGSFAVLSRLRAPDDIGHVLAFAIGAGIAFAGVNALVTRGFRQRVKNEPPVVLSLATSFSVVSSTAGIGVAILLGKTVSGWPAWLLGGLLASWVYLGISALEVALARTLHLVVGEQSPEER
jgi:MFS family permease